jgi:hypothetical protein
MYFSGCAEQRKETFEHPRLQQWFELVVAIRKGEEYKARQFATYEGL